MKDVETTLLITIVLVVAVIFLFLRDIRATLIPSAVIPLALLATMAVMLPLKFSLVREASHQRLRPILMTTACAALGGVPMILMNGTVGGLIVSQALTLFTTPVVYIYLDRLRRHPKQPAAGTELLTAA